LLSTYLVSAGYAIQAGAQVAQGSTAKAVAKANAAVIRQNATFEGQAAEAEALQFENAAEIARQDATIAAESAAFREQQARLLAARTQGERRASIGASGVTLTGSPLAVLLDNAYQAETEALLIRYEGQLNVLAKRQDEQSALYSAEVRRVTGERTVLAGEYKAGLSEAEGSAKFTGAFLGAAGTLATGLGKYYGSKTSPGITD
jgi:hypothetical protein